MGLQIRLRHALGERVLELVDRDVSRPWVIGRGNEADLKIPSVGVAPQHAVLFVHEGHWVVQGDGGLTTLNGEPLEMAAALRIGDVIGLGCEPYPPTLEIDPVSAAQGRTGPALAVSGALGSSPGRAQGAVVPGVAPVRGPIVPTSALTPAAAPTAASAGFGDTVHRPIRPEEPIDADESVSATGGADDGDTIAWPPQTPASTTTEFYVPKGRQTPVGLIVVAVIVAVAALVGVAIVAYERANRPKVVVIQPPPVNAPRPASEAPKPKLFDVDAEPASARQAQLSDSPSSPPAGPPPESTSGTGSSADSSSGTSPVTASESKATAATPARAAPEGAVGSPPAVAADDNPPDPDDPEWKEIEAAHFNVRRQGVAIVKYDEYRRAHPGKYTSWLDQYSDDAANWLYWQYVAQLWKQRDDLTAEVNQKKKDLQHQPAGAFHDELVKDKADLDGRLADTAKRLTDEMGYTADMPPDLDKPSELRQLSAKRNPTKYAAFKTHVLRYARDHHGSVWWEGE